MARRERGSTQGARGIGGIVIIMILAGCGEDAANSASTTTQDGGDWMQTTGASDAAHPVGRDAASEAASAEDGASDATDSNAAAASGTSGGDAHVQPGCYDCSGGHNDMCVQFDCALPDPCDSFVRRDDSAFGGGTGVANPPSYENEDTGGDCILKALQAGTQGRYTIEHNPGGQYLDKRTLYVLAERRAVQVFEAQADNIFRRDHSARLLHAPEQYNACFGDVDAMWECLTDPVDTTACYSVPSCP